MAQLSTLGIKIGLMVELVGWSGEVFGGSVFMSKISAVRFGLARAWRCELTGRSFPIGGRSDWPGFIMDFTSLMPNKSPEPTPVTPALLSRSRRLADVISPAWFSFFR